jgi:hypothetical protein
MIYFVDNRLGRQSNRNRPCSSLYYQIVSLDGQILETECTRIFATFNNNDIWSFLAHPAHQHGIDQFVLQFIDPATDQLVEFY